jgi:hypothetical protein
MKKKMGTLTATANITAVPDQNTLVTFTVALRDQHGDPVPFVPIQYILDSVNMGPVGETNTLGIMTYSTTFAPGQHTLQFKAALLLSNTIVITSGNGGNGGGGEGNGNGNGTSQFPWLLLLAAAALAFIASGLSRKGRRR